MWQLVFCVFCITLLLLGVLYFTTNNSSGCEASPRGKFVKALRHPSTLSDCHLTVRRVKRYIRLPLIFALMAISGYDIYAFQNHLSPIITKSYWQGIFYTIVALIACVWEIWPMLFHKIRIDGNFLTLSTGRDAQIELPVSDISKVHFRVGYREIAPTITLYDKARNAVMSMGVSTDDYELLKCYFLAQEIRIVDYTEDKNAIDSDV